MLNTDQGSQFTGLEFNQVLQNRGVKVNMASPTVGHR